MSDLGFELGVGVGGGVHGVSFGVVACWGAPTFPHILV